MDWNQIITTLGAEVGILPSVVILGVGWAYWKSQQRISQLTERLIEQSQASYADAAKREAETLLTLQTINASLNTVVTLIQSRGQK